MVAPKIRAGDGWLTVKDGGGRERKYLRRGPARDASVVHIDLDRPTGTIAARYDKEGWLLCPEKLPEKVVVYEATQPPPGAPLGVLAAWGAPWDYDWDGMVLVGRVEIQVESVTGRPPSDERKAGLRRMMTAELQALADQPLSPEGAHSAIANAITESGHARQEAEAKWWAAIEGGLDKVVF
jgi:hypothetical protein